MHEPEVLSSDFPGLRTYAIAASMTSTASVASMTFTALFHEKILILMVLSILVPFSGMDHQKSNFLLISEPFLLEAVEAS